MSRQIFRKVSLERLSSPEQLDQLFSVTSPRAWISLAAISLILVTALLWGIFGRIPTKVGGQGIIMKSYGVHNIIHTSSGQVTDIRVAVGDPVKRGDIVARLNQPQLVEEINDLKTQLEQLKNLSLYGFDLDGERKPGSALAGLYDLIRRAKDARALLPYEEANYQSAISGRQHEIEITKISLQQARVSEKNKKEYLDKIAVLFADGIVSENEFNSARKDFDLARLATQAAEENLARLTAGEWQETIISYKARLQQAQLNIQMLEEQFDTTRAIKISETENRIAKLQDFMLLSSNIVSQVDGRVLEVQAKKGDIIQPGMNIASLEREGKTVKLEVTVYVRAEDGKNIRPGMEAQISPSTVKKEEYGFMLGRVVSVSEYPTTAEGMMHTLGSRDLVAKLSGQYAPLEVRIDVITDDSTESGYKWSSSKGPPMKINSGTLCAGEISIREQRPISMVIPMVKKALSIY